LSATFPITTKGVDQTTVATVKATSDNLAVNLTLTVQAASKLTHTLTSAQVEAGWDTGGIVTLDAATGPGGLVVKLVPTNKTLIAIPAVQLTFPANTKAMGYLVNTATASSDKTVGINATAPGFSGAATLTLIKTSPVQMALDKTSVQGGKSVKLTLTLDNVAPGAGFPLKLSSSSSAVIPPANVTVVSATRTVTVSVPTSVVKAKQTVTITVTSGSVKLGTINMAVTP
jgi:hypothetical protein